jgi:hypothetical protein
MGVRSMTVRRFDEIRRRLSEGRGLREIARALSCSRDTVREVRDGLRNSPDAPKALPDPLWMLQVDWPPLIHDLGIGHPLKFPATRLVNIVIVFMIAISLSGFAFKEKCARARRNASSSVPLGVRSVGYRTFEPDSAGAPWAWGCNLRAPISRNSLGCTRHGLSNMTNAERRQPGNHGNA